MVCSETKLKDDCKMLASLQTQPQLNLQDMETTSEKEMPDAYHKDLNDSQQGL